MDLRFDSFDAMLDHIEGYTMPDWLPDYLSDHAGDFTGDVKTRSAALKLAREGWIDGRAQAAPITSALFNRVSSKIERHDPVHDIEGSQIDIAAFVDGQPECWTRLVPTVVDGFGNRIIRIALNCGASAIVDQSVINAKGAAILALVELLELAGYRVELWLVKAFTAKHDSPTLLSTRALLKSADQDFDAARMAYALAHPSMLRTLTFIMAASENRKIAKQLQFDDTDRSGFYAGEDTFADEYDLYIGRSVTIGNEAVRWQNVETAQRWIIETLKNSGVELSEN